MARGSKPKPPNRGGYRITTQPEGTRVSYWADPRGIGHGSVRVGTIESHKSDTVLVVWDDDDEHYEQWDGAELRYRVERGQMNLKRPAKERRVRVPSDQLLCKTCGQPRSEKCGCKRQGAVKPENWGQKVVPSLLTGVDPHDMMDISIGGNAPIDKTTKGHMMAKKAAQVEEIEELDELDEVTESASANDDEGMLTAKQAATKLGTDARTLRKFLRKKSGTIGQGQRWAINEDDMPSLKAEFDAWGKGGKTTPAKPTTATKPAAKPAAKAKKSTAPVPDEDIYSDGDDEFEALDNDALLGMDEIDDLEDLEEE